MQNHNKFEKTFWIVFLISCVLAFAAALFINNGFAEIGVIFLITALSLSVIATKNFPDCG